MSVEKDKSPLVLEEKAQPPAYTAAPPTVVYQPTVVSAAPPDDQLVMSLFTTFCCFWPLGMFAIIKSIEARTAYQSGRHQDAAAATRSAKTFNKLSILVGVIILVAVLVLQLTWIIPTAVLAATAPDDRSGED